MKLVYKKLNDKDYYIYKDKLVVVMEADMNQKLAKEMVADGSLNKRK